MAGLPTSSWAANDKTTNSKETTQNSQTALLPIGLSQADPEVRVGGPTLDIVGDASVVAPNRPDASTPADLNGDASNRKQTSIYVVRSGDTLAEVAEMFDVSVKTIIWANDIKGSSIQEGQILVILPVSGVRHEVEEGETLSEIADRYDGSEEEIREFNDLSGSSLAVGAIIDIPGGEMPQTESSSAGSQANSPGYASGAVRPGQSVNVASGYYVHPVPGSVITQRAHGYNAVDFGAQSGSSVLASASGRVIKSVGGGWNGGYGRFVVIEHGNGTQTLYSHLSGIIVSRGQRVVRGQVIGYVGVSGRSSGPHLHFEVRGTNNPFSACGVRSRCGS